MSEAAPPAPRFAPLQLLLAPANLALLVGFGAMAIPTLAGLGLQVWSTEAGAHGPIVLAVGAWLLVRGLVETRAPKRPGSLALVLTGLLFSLALYVFGRAFDFISLEVAGLYGAAVVLLYSRIGPKALASVVFPIAYLAFLVPPPGWLMDDITAPLKQFVSWAATVIVSAAGIPISQEGVTLYVGSYQLLVEDACSGMNSMIGLVAVSLLYIYLLRASTLRYAVLLASMTIPVAVLGNLIRIIVLILLTFFFGDEVAQGFLHEVAGLFLFAVALVLVFSLDMLLWRIVPKSWKQT
jgi:exosortase